MTVPQITHRITWLTNYPEPSGWVPLGTVPRNQINYAYFASVEAMYRFKQETCDRLGYSAVPYELVESYWIPLPPTLKEALEDDV